MRAADRASLLPSPSRRPLLERDAPAEQQAEHGAAPRGRLNSNTAGCVMQLQANISNLHAAGSRGSSTTIGVEGGGKGGHLHHHRDRCGGGALERTGRHCRYQTGAAANPNRGIAFVETATAKAFAMSHWLVGGVDVERLSVRSFDGAGNIRENQPHDVLASGTTMQWASAAKGETGRSDSAQPAASAIGGAARTRRRHCADRDHQGVPGSSRGGARTLGAGKT